MLLDAEHQVTNNKLGAMAYIFIIGQLGPLDFKLHIRNLFTHGKNIMRC